MPWKEASVTDLRYEFVRRALREEEPFAALCREYGIATKTGYKWKRRFIRGGRPALLDAPRRPDGSPRALSEAVVCEVVRLKEAHRTWGPAKLRELYRRAHPAQDLPSLSTFKRVLDRAGLVKKRRRRRSGTTGRLSHRVVALRPHDVWTVDFKGWWRTRDGAYCEPLTVRDAFSRYVLCALPLASRRTETVKAVFEALFRTEGMPGCIRSDNGSPFAGRGAPLGLSRLSVWWLSLGIDLDRIAPGRPGENGGHERMHRDIWEDMELNPRETVPEQAAALEVWRRTFNEERPHESLGMRRPADLYHRSERVYTGTPDRLDYPAGLLCRRVSKVGQIRLHRAQIFLSMALCGWDVGLKLQKDGTYEVSFGRDCLGRVDPLTASFQALRGVQHPANSTEEQQDAGAPASPGPQPPEVDS